MSEHPSEIAPPPRDVLASGAMKFMGEYGIVTQFHLQSIIIQVLVECSLEKLYYTADV